MNHAAKKFAWAARALLSAIASVQAVEATTNVREALTFHASLDPEYVFSNTHGRFAV